MTPEQAREIDRLEFEADCRAARERAHELVARRHAERPLPFGRERILAPESDHVVLRKSSAKLYSLDGNSRSLKEWAAMCGCSVPTLRWRMKRGMTFEQAVTTPRLSSAVRWEQQTGVVKNLPALEGTGGGSTAQDIPQLEFSH